MKALLKKENPLFYFCSGAFLLSLFCLYHLFRFRQGFDQSQWVPYVPRMDFDPVMRWATGLRTGGVQGYEAASAAGNPDVYPPLFTLIFVPFTFLPPQAAYPLYMTILTVCLYFTGALGLKFGPADSSPLRRYWSALFALGILLNTYPVAFSFSRGNSDIMAAFFSMLALAQMQEGRPLWASFFLTLGTQFKVYPAVLGVLLFLRGGSFAALAFLLMNAAAFLSLGPRLFVFFRSTLVQFAQDPYLWVGNHSTLSFVSWLKQEHWINESVKSHAYAWINKGSVLIFGAAVLWEIRCGFRRLFAGFRIQPLRGPFSAAETCIAGMAFQLMGLLPWVSHDYKLVIQAVPFLILLNRSFGDFRLPPGVLCFVLVLLCISVAYVFTPLPILGSLESSKTPGLIVAFLCYAALFFGACRARANSSLA